MKRIVRSIGGRLLARARDSWWRLLHARARNETRNLVFGSCLVIAPHPDDETLGCGATILRKRAAGSTVSVAIVTDGKHRNRQSRLTMDEIGEIRRREAIEACRRLGVADDRVFFFDFPNGELAEHTDELRDRLSELIATLDPDEVFTTPAHDGHRDHNAVGRVVSELADAGEITGAVHAYPIEARLRWPWPRGWRAPASTLRAALVEPIAWLLRERPVTVSTNGYLDAKREALASYRSQLTNITGEETWRTLSPDFVDRFLQADELFLRIGTPGDRPRPGPSKIRVLNVMPALIFGGGQFHLMRHLQTMDPEQFDHTVAYLLPWSEMVHVFRRAGLQPVCLDHRSVLHAPRTVLRLVRLIKREGIDVVHTNTRYDRLYGQLAAFLCGVPVVNTLRSAYSANRYEDSRAEAGWFRRPLARLRLALEDALERRVVVEVIAISEDVRDAWLARPGAQRVANGSVTVVYPGLAFDRYDLSPDSAPVHDLRRELAIDGRGPVLVNVARLTPNKGQGYLVDLTRAVRQRWPDAITLLAGDGRTHDDLERQIASAGLDDAVVLLGHRNDVPALLALGDVFVFPSLTEGFGNAVLEAQASGTAVLAFDIPALREFVDDGSSGRLVPVGDETALAEACLDLLDDPERTTAMGRLGREQAEARFDVRIWSGKLASIYERASRQRKRSRSRLDARSHAEKGSP